MLCYSESYWGLYFYNCIDNSRKRPWSETVFCVCTVHIVLLRDRGMKMRYAGGIFKVGVLNVNLEKTLKC